MRLSFFLHVAAAGVLAAQDFPLPPDFATNPTVFAKHMPVLARDVESMYRGELRVAARAPETVAANRAFAIYAAAMRRADSASRTDVLRDELATALRGLDDGSAFFLFRALAVNPRALDGAVNESLRPLAGRNTITLTEALPLVRAYRTREVLQALAPLARAVVAEEDARRYVIERNVQVRTPDGATVCALIVRPKAAGRLPTLLNFTIYADTIAKLVEARRAAASGYAGVMGFSRGKLCSPGTAIPYEYDGADAAALIDWVAAQPWSDGRVGMYGGSYEGFTTWAAAKHEPKALKAIAPLVAVGPGLDVPMEGNVIVNFIYQWPYFTTNNKTLDSATYNDFPRWNRLNREWYVSGRAYRDMPKIDGTPNPIWERWIAHPTYDAYWRRMIPYRREFVRVNIPVLQTAGYYYGGPGAAVHYFTEHTKYFARGEHYLVIGPYDHPGGQRGVVNALGDTTYTFAGLPIDPVALVDLQHLRYAFFDYVLKGAPKPALLKDKVNYQVVGANTWGHARSIAAMSNDKVRVPLVGSLSVDLMNRKDIDRMVAGGGVMDTAIDTVDVLTFLSDPLPRPMQANGLFSGALEVITNKKDFDLYVSLLELTPKGQYVQLSTMTLRASHARDLKRRTLLAPGQRQRIPFSSIRLMSRQMSVGSRLVVQIGPIKAPGLQINYGTGKDVSDETIADGREPIRMQLLPGSHIDVPTRH